MESRAILRFSGIPANKMRQVADLVRGREVDTALHSLQFVTKSAARPMAKLIQSAVANAREKSAAGDERFDADRLFVKMVQVDEGPTQKRVRPRAQGRAYRIRKRSCHVSLVLGEHAPKAPRRKPAAKAEAAAKETPKKGRSGGSKPEAKTKTKKKEKKAAAAAK